MEFLRPAAFALLALALPLVALHLRVRRRRRVAVSSLRLWRDVAAPGGGRAGLRRLHETTALALALAALAAAATALADPVTGAPPPPPRGLVLVLDGSATMNARGAGGATRFDAARDAARALVARLAPGDDVTLWLAAGAPQVLVSPTTDRAQVAVALDAARPTLEPPSLLAAVELARLALRTRGNAAPLCVVTDAPGSAALAGAAEPVGDAALHVISVGGAGASNAGVVGAVPAPGGVRVRVRATDGPAASRRLVVASDAGGVVASLPVELAAGDETTRDVALPRGTRGRVTVRLEPPDEFPDDDAAALVLDDAPPLRVLVTAPSARPTPYLLEALRAQPELVDAAAARLADAVPPASAYDGVDVVVAEGALPAGLPATLPHVVFAETAAPVREPVVWGVGTHPVLDGVDLASLRLDRAGALVPRAGERPLVESAAGVLAVAGEAGGVRHVRFGFRADASTLPLEAAFPLLVRNALRWVRGGAAPPPAVRAGAPVPLAGLVPRGTPRVDLVLDGVAHAADLGPDGAEPLAPLPLPGGARRLDVVLPGGALQATTAVQWALPAGVRVGAAAEGPSLADALPALAPRRAPGEPLRRHARSFALAAALLAALGALAAAPRGAPARAAAAV